ncbi:MAG: Arc family DNA-binding protein [Spirochaetales bacterium]|nr:Arc family DNA-binding protein [Spirochaetales bacterium]
MPTLQVRDLPQELYNKIAYIAEKEHRSLAQETIVLLKEGLEKRLDNKNRRAKIIKSFTGLGIDTSGLPSPEEIIREDRDSR